MGAQGLLAVGPVPQPQWVLFVKIAICFLCLIILALSAYALSLTGGYGVYYGGGAPGYLIFLVIKTWIIYGLAIFFELKMHNLFYRIAFLIAYILSIIFWLSGWAWAASWASAMLAYAGIYNGTLKNFGGAMAGCAALGAIVWVLVIINFVFFILGCLKSDNTAGNVELGHQGGKVDAGAQQPYGQPQPQYGAQPGTQPGYTHPPQQQAAYPQQQTYATQ